MLHNSFVVVAFLFLSCVFRTNGNATTTSNITGNITLCYVFPNDFTTLGFDYNFNIARIRAHAVITPRYPLVTIRTASLLRATEAANFTDSFIQMIYRHNCTLMLSTSNLNFNRVKNFTAIYPAMFPQVLFVEYNSPLTVTSPALLPPNYRGFSVSTGVAWFVAGAAAAVQCRRAVGFVHPGSGASFAVSAFYRGMLFAMRNNLTSPASPVLCPLYTISTGTFLDPVAETQITRLLIQKGVDIIAFWSDGLSVSEVVRSSSTLADPLFSIAYNTDAALFLGDTVLISVLLQPQTLIESELTSAIVNRTVYPQFATGLDGAIVSSLSPRGSRNASHAARAALAHQQATFDVWCGGLIRPNGTTLYTGCLPDSQSFSTVMYELGMSILPAFNRSRVCPRGTEPLYDLVNLSLRCVPCLGGNFSAGGGALCVPCPSFTSPNVSHDGCVAAPPASPRPANLGLILGILLPLVFVAVVGSLASYVTLFRAAAPPPPAPPPVGPVVYLVLVCVDPERSVANWRANIDVACATFEQIFGVMVACCRRHRGYVTKTSADAWLVATETLNDAIAIADEAVSQFHQSESGTHVTLRAAVTAGWTRADRPALPLRGGRTSLTLFPAVGNGEGCISREQKECAACAWPSATLGEVTAATPIEYTGTPLSSLISGVVYAWSAVEGHSLVLFPDVLHVDPAAAEMVLLALEADKRCITRRTWTENRPGSARPTRDVIMISDRSTAAASTPPRPAVVSTTGFFDSSVSAVSHSSPLGDDGRHEISEEVLARFSLLNAQQVLVLANISTCVLRLFLKVLSVDARKECVREARRKLCLVLDMRGAKRTTEDASGKTQIVFGETFLIRSIVQELLSTMDEQELHYFATHAVSRHRVGFKKR